MSLTIDAAAAPILPPISHVARLTDAALNGDQRVWEALINDAGRFAVNLLTAIAIIVLTLWASRWLAGLVRRAIGRMPLHGGGPDTTLQSFASSFVRWSVLIVGMIAVLQQLGVQATSILAMLGAASLAIGLALQGALSNVAAGVMILLLRPYKIGDFVEINGKMGTVKGLDMFGTRLSDPDNLDIFMPNSKVFGEMIINYASPATRRMELNFRIDYDDDHNLALATLLECVREDKRLLTTPEPWSGMTALAESSVTVTVRAWAPVAIYWDARFDLIKRVKERFQAAGLTFPYPHQVGIIREFAPAQTKTPAVSKGSTRRRKSEGDPTPSQGGV
ncbi:MAG: mechanosensitive ion channel family protein [Caulobacteraceae bacterium]|nr:mechanosensitive ion channel family protein [Caulobacteraceae bacterium]